MKTTILIHENEHWVYYPGNAGKIEHIARSSAGECFFFDPVRSSATSVVPQKATTDDPRAGHLVISIEFDARELDWFLDRPSRIEGLKEWLKNLSKADAKRYALEELSKFPAKEIEANAVGFEAKAALLNAGEKEIVLHFMTAVIAMNTVNPEIFVIAKKQRDDLIIEVLKLLPKAFRKVEISMPWSSGLDLGRISITDENELPMISRPMFLVPGAGETLVSKFSEQSAVAKMFLNNKSLAAEDLAPSDILNKSEKFRNIWRKLHPEKNILKKPVAPVQVKQNTAAAKPAVSQNKSTVSTQQHSGKEVRGGTDPVQKKRSTEKKIGNKKLVDFIALFVDELLIVVDYVYYLKYIADPSRIYTVALMSMMTGILFCSLMFYVTDKNN